MGKQKKMVKLSFCLGLVLMFVFSTVTVYAAGLTAEQLKQRLEKFKGPS